MALIDEIEPPSPDDAEKTNIFEFLIEIKNHLNISKRLLLVLLRSIFSKFGFSKTNNDNTLRFKFVRAKNFIVNNRYLPHIAIILLSLVVLVSNQKDRISAEAYYTDMVSLSPDTQFNVANNVDKFTLLIPDDSGAVERVAIADASDGGFINNTGVVLTQITSREVPLPNNAEKTVEYVVKSGDTLSVLGLKFDVKIATLKYLNDLGDVDSIRPGMKLKVPPKGYEVSASAIAKKEADRKSKLAASNRSTTTRNSSDSRAPKVVKYAGGSKYNGYPYGYCTYYVATIRNVPSSWGDAKEWLNSARRSGNSTGSTPAVGAIVVTAESWWGHLAYVESVDGDNITISEMNARGWGVVSRRSIPAYGGVVRGYIY